MNGSDRKSSQRARLGDPPFNGQKVKLYVAGQIVVGKAKEGERTRTGTCNYKVSLDRVLHDRVNRVIVLFDVPSSVLQLVG